MKKYSILIVGAILLVLGLAFITTQNSLISLEQDVQMQKSQIETNLQRRSDLIPNLVATVKGYTAHEEKVYTEIAEARTKLAGSIESGNIEDISAASNELDNALGRLLAVAEAYPELKASEQFIALQDELAGTENRIAVSRQYYNEKVKAYNTYVGSFPSSIIAGLLGYRPLPYFEASSTAHEVPTVTFD